MFTILMHNARGTKSDGHQKCLALGLNCLAALLGRDSDEIIFIDDDSGANGTPTIELIGDTLTNRVKSALKIFAPLSPGKASSQRGADRLGLGKLLNHCVEKSNPDNRHILYMAPGSFLFPLTGATDIGAALDSVEEAAHPMGGYHLFPGFNLPAFLWEAADRRDPEALFAAIRHIGGRMADGAWQGHRIDDVRHAPATGVFVHRTLLQDVGGFWETEIPDSCVIPNLMKRLQLTGRPYSGIEGSFVTFECRSPLPAGGPAAMPDAADLIRWIDGPTVPGQPRRDRPAARLYNMFPPGAGAAARLSSALSKKENGEEGAPTLLRFGQAEDRNLLHLADLLAHCGRATTVGYVGANPDTLRGLLALAPLTGGDMAIRYDLALITQPAEGAIPSTIQDIAREASFLVIDASGPGQPDAETELTIKGRFLTWLRLETDAILANRIGISGRRDVVYLGNPYTSLGYMIRSRVVRLQSEPAFYRGRAACPALDGPGCGPTELSASIDAHIALEFIQKLGDALDPKSHVQEYANWIGPPILEKIRQTWRANEDTGKAQWWQSILALTESVSPRGQAVARWSLTTETHPENTLTKLASSHDWNDPEWFVTATDLMRLPESVNFHLRHRNSWALVQAAYALQTLGCLHRETTGACIVQSPHKSYAGLGSRLGHLSIVDVPAGPITRQIVEERWGTLSPDFLSDRITLCAPADLLHSGTDGTLDFLLIGPGLIDGASFQETHVNLFQSLTRPLRKGGTLILILDVCLHGAYPNAPTIDFFLGSAEAEAWAGNLGLMQIGTPQRAFDEETLYGYVRLENLGRQMPEFVVDVEQDLITSFVAVFRKEDHAPERNGPRSVPV
ncbi:hypothetical protein HL658_35630 [Azospirillum sp. RWY-5-1]|uniref:Uncharacterized protein n=1 Tax=Azospirillum oleiclasticum TaxID=2735135 RepID=A0ABX2TLZ0_9PROT|nr:hypothetical protein [Azospirillum oleiclasticum]NYZ17903.1 hypothetical protein [Azospirillum oleiclasticum]NYZ25122.1 hypothetical protein [Azospirillum oleiclasticum]